MPTLPQQADAPPARPLQGELDAELARELQSYNIDPLAEGMTDDQYADAMAELKRRREATLVGKSRAELARVDHMRTTLMWHIQHVSSDPDAWAAHNTVLMLSGSAAYLKIMHTGNSSRSFWLQVSVGSATPRLSELRHEAQAQVQQPPWMPWLQVADDMQRQRRLLPSGRAAAAPIERDQPLPRQPPPPAELRTLKSPRLR